MPLRTAATWLGRLEHRLELLSEHLHGEVAPGAGQELVEAQLDGLRELVDVARERPDRLLDPFLQFGLGQARVAIPPAA